MLRFQDENFKICQIDTCVISDLFEDSSRFRRFLDMRESLNLLLGISISTLFELKKAPERYEWFKNEFTALPTFLLKSADMLLKDEIKSYPNENAENSLFYYLFEGKELLEHFDSSPKFQNTVKFLENNKHVVLNSILSLKSNFQADKDGKFSNLRIEEFVKKVTIQQLKSFFPKWFNQFDPMIKIETEIFKSLRSQLLMTFWKFYLMVDRKARKSDVFDISIVSSLPYVDIFITEKNMKNDIDQIKNKKLFFKDLVAMTINEI